MDVGAVPMPVRRYASFGSRLAAWLIDLVVMLVAFLILGSAWRAFGESHTDAWGATTILSLAYLVWFTSRGATLGKKALGIRVIGPDGGPPGLWRAAKRQLVIPIVSSVALFIAVALFALVFVLAWAEEDAGTLGGLALVGFILVVAVVIFGLYDCLSMLSHPQKRTIHDRISGTWVVEDPGPG